MYRLRGEILGSRRGNAYGFRWLLRAALSLFIEDPPLELGRCVLARTLLPDEPEPLRRGHMLQAVLRQAIETLKPLQENDDRPWRGYRILSGEYYEGETRTTLEKRLALSASTYSREKRAALIRVASALMTLFPCVPARETPPAVAPEVTERVLEQVTQYLYNQSCRAARNSYADSSRH
jgi:hypothetical protein